MKLGTLLFVLILAASLMSQTQTFQGLKTMKLVSYQSILNEAIYMDETPVTYTDYEVYVRAGGQKNAYWYYDSYHIAEQPVTGISWHVAVDYCNWRSACEGLEPVYRLTKELDEWGYPVYEIIQQASGYRLPYSTEFEHAARSGNTDFLYPWGMKFDESLANYDTDQGFKSTEWWRLAPVKTQFKNAFGLYNMCGNNWHWCSDWKQKGRTKVLKGGSWGTVSAAYLKLDAASHSSPGSYNYDIGFRCVRLARYVDSEQGKVDTTVKYHFLQALQSKLQAPVNDWYGTEFKQRLSRFIADNYPECINFLMEIDQQQKLTPDAMADLIIKVCKRNRINPLFLASIMISESGFGTVSFPRWYNNPMAFHWQNKLMAMGLPVYESMPGKKNRKYATLEIGFEAFCKGIRRDLYYKAARKNLDSFHLIYVGYRADEWMLTLSRVYRDVAGIRFEPLYPQGSAGKLIYADWDKLSP